MGTAGRRAGTWGLRCALVVALLIGLVAVQAGTVAAASPDPSLKVAARQLLQVINADRARLHARPLALDKRQSTCSQRHSKHMAVMGDISHDQFPSDVCVPYTMAAENVGSESGDPQTAVLDLNTQMMNEGPCPHKNCPGDEYATHGHYMNLVNPAYTHVGIGIVVTGTTVWLTENFTG